MTDPIKSPSGPHVTTTITRTPKLPPPTANTLETGNSSNHTFVRAKITHTTAHREMVLGHPIIPTWNNPSPHDSPVPSPPSTPSTIRAEYNFSPHMWHSPYPTKRFKRSQINPNTIHILPRPGSEFCSHPISRLGRSRPSNLLPFRPILSSTNLLSFDQTILELLFSYLHAEESIPTRITSLSHYFPQMQTVIDIKTDFHSYIIQHTNTPSNIHLSPFHTPSSPYHFRWPNSPLPST